LFLALTRLDVKTETSADREILKLLDESGQAVLHYLDNPLHDGNVKIERSGGYTINIKKHFPSFPYKLDQMYNSNCFAIFPCLSGDITMQCINRTDSKGESLFVRPMP